MRSFLLEKMALALGAGGERAKEIAMSKTIGKVMAKELIPREYLDESEPLGIGVYASQGGVELTADPVTLTVEGARELAVLLEMAAAEAARMAAHG